MRYESRRVVRPGIEVLRDQGFGVLAGKRVGLMTNPSAVDSSYRSTLDILHAAENVNLVALFSPEHGFAGAAADGEAVASMVDVRTGLPVHSLYGETLRPTAAMLTDIDVIVCDIQDIGIRYYTFTWTISHIIEAAGEYGVEVIILDRPNPLGGDVAGPLLDPALASLVGRFPVPVQHGMTLGEVAQMINARWNPHPAGLTMIACESYEERLTLSQITYAYVPPSPNMPQYTTVMQYAGACLIEGTTLSEGRGTALPFEIVGAPYIDAHVLAERLNVSLSVDAVRCRPHSFKPTTSKYAGIYCHGVQVHVVDAAAFDALDTWLTIIREIRQMYPDEFAWLSPYREGSLQHFDRLIGNVRVRQQIDTGETIATITAQWSDEVADFVTQRMPYLHYGV